MRTGFNKPFKKATISTRSFSAVNIQSQFAIRRRAASDRGRISAWKGFGKHDSPDVYSPDGVISFPSGPTTLRMSIVAHREAIAIQTLPMARNRPGQILLY